MTRTRTSTVLQRIRPWLVAFGVFQLTVRVGGLLLARRRDSGDATSDRIRRLRTMGQVKLAPTSQSLAEVGVDLMYAGLELDLTQARPAPGGIDLTVRCAFAGGDVTIPANWRVASDSKGIGGLGVKRGHDLDITQDPATADLRIHLRAMFGGLGVKAGPRA